MASLISFLQHSLYLAAVFEFRICSKSTQSPQNSIFPSTSRLSHAGCFSETPLPHPLLFWGVPGPSKPWASPLCLFGCPSWSIRIKFSSFHLTCTCCYSFVQILLFSYFTIFVFYPFFIIILFFLNNRTLVCNRLLKHVINWQAGGGVAEITGRRGRRRKQLLDDLKENERIL